MSVTPSPIGGFAGQFFDNNGNPLSGGKIFTYAAGTTTPQAAYTSASGATPHSNPIVLDSAGRVPSGEIWLTDGLVYKFVIETATSILIGTYDNITGVNSNFVNYTVQEEVITATAGQTVFNLSTINYTPGTNSLTVYIDGVNQYVGDSYLETDSDTVTFTAGLHVGAEVKFTTAVQTTSGAVNANIVAYDPPFTGGVATNVEAKLAQYISVKDFGAVGDGVADDTAAVQAAINYAGNLNGLDVFFPAGNYLCGVLTTRQNVTLRGVTGLQGGGAKITCTGAFAFKTEAAGSFIFFNMYNLTVFGDRGVTDFIDQTLGGSWAFSTIEACYLVNFLRMDVLTTGNRFINNNIKNFVYCRFRGADFTIANNFFGFDDADLTATSTDAFVSLTAATGIDFVGNYITSMKTTNAPIPMVVETSSQDVRLISNWFDGGEDFALAFKSGAATCVATANRLAVLYPSCVPILLSNVTDITVNDNIIQGLAASAPFVSFASTLKRCFVQGNITNNRTDSTVHDYVLASATIASGVSMAGYGLAVKNISANFDVLPPVYSRTLTNQSASGLVFFYVYPSTFLAGDYFNFSRTNTGQRLIIYDNENATAIYDSNTAGFDRGKIFSYAAGSIVVES